ncbi:MAG: site-specific integrase [Betaproteobacteria bacterium]|nr:site-specific integrase [Betaproteobacteria bacterium]
MAAIRKRGSKWQARVKRNGQTLDKSFLTKADAQRWARTIEAEIERGAFRPYPKATQITLEAALGRYGREVTPQKRGAAIEQCRIRTLVKHPLAQEMLASIRAADIAAYRDERKQAGKAASTLAKELGLISAVFKIAIAEWGMEDLINPVAGVKKPRQPNGRERRLFPGEEEWLLRAFGEMASAGEIPRAAINPWIQPIVIVAVETAMRRGEILSLRWENIDLAKRVAHLPITKNGTSRDVPLSLRAVQTLQSLPRSITGSVFPISANALKLAFKRGLCRAQRWYAQHERNADPKMFANLRFHDLRHEATSRLAGVFEAHELAKVTGHRDLKMLLSYYHPRAEELARKLG